MFDIVTVVHNHENYKLSESLLESLRQHEDPGSFNFIRHSNMGNNLGFAKGCNIGASQGDAEFIGFINPDAEILAPILATVAGVFADESIVITGERFNKADWELRGWGVRDWVCGACFFVRRDWFERVGRFDEGYVWAWEETDLIRRAQEEGRLVRSITLPVRHESPSNDNAEDVEYKTKHFAASGARFYRRWGNER